MRRSKGNRSAPLGRKICQSDSILLRHAPSRRGLLKCLHIGGGVSTPSSHLPSGCQTPRNRDFLHGSNCLNGSLNRDRRAFPFSLRCFMFALPARLGKVMQMARRVCLPTCSQSPSQVLAPWHLVTACEALSMTRSEQEKRAAQNRFRRTFSRAVGALQLHVRIRYSSRLQSDHSTPVIGHDGIFLEAWAVISISRHLNLGRIDK